MSHYLHTASQEIQEVIAAYTVRRDAQNTIIDRFKNGTDALSKSMVRKATDQAMLYENRIAELQGGAK